MPPRKEQSMQKFRSGWLNIPGLKKWLQEKKDSKGQSVAYCKVCLCYLSSNKLCDLKDHENTKKHLKNANEMSGAVRQQVLPFEKKSKITDAQIAEGKLSLFIAEHCSMNTCDHLTSVCKSCFKDSRIASQTTMKRTKCSGIIKNVLYPHFMEDIRNAVGDNPYSLLIDESSDISKIENLGVAIIYYRQHDPERGNVNTSDERLSFMILSMSYS